MNCREFDDRLNLLLDERRLPGRDGRLLAHADACATCGEILAAQEALFSGLELHDAPPLSPQFAARVVAAFPVVQNRGYWNVATWAAIAATAAAVLIAVTLALSNRSIGDPANGPIAERPSNAARQTGPLFSAVQAAPRQQAAQPAQAALPVEFPTGVRPERYREYRDALHGLAMQLPDAVEQLESVEVYAPGIRPVRASFSVAIDALRRTIPGRRDIRPGTPQAGTWEPLPIVTA